MALTREEIEAIAKEVADKITPKAQVCRCGLAVWEAREREEFFKAIIENKSIPWLGNMPHLMEVSLSNVEQMCRIDMKKPKELLKDLQRNIEAEDWQDANVTRALLHGSIVGPLKEGAEGGGSNPGNPTSTEKKRRCHGPFLVNWQYGGYSYVEEDPDKPESLWVTGMADYVNPDEVITIAEREGIAVISLAGSFWERVGYKGWGEKVSISEAKIALAKAREHVQAPKAG